MNKFLAGVLAGIFAGVQLAQDFSPEAIVWSAMILLVPAILLLILFHHGVRDFQDYE